MTLARGLLSVGTVPRPNPSKRASHPRPSWSAIKKMARERFEVGPFRAGQRELITAALEGRSALGVLPTGAGKSLCFQLPAQFLPHATVVVSPLLALIRDQKQKLVEGGFEVSRLDSTVTAKEQEDTWEDLGHGKSIVYLTPERLERPEVTERLKKTGVSLFVVDEAHCVSQWGHDFRPAYLAVRDAVARLGRPPVLALTATATPEVTRDILAQLGIGAAEVVRTDSERRNLFFEVVRTPSEDSKRTALAQLLRDTTGSVIVYAATIATAVALSEWLCSQKIDATLYHGKLKLADRRRHQDDFMSGKARVVVATAAFGLGIDKADVRMVVHYNFPDSLESYYQEAGRGGRDGEPARAVLLYRLEDRRVQAYFLGGKYPRRDQLLAIYDAATKHDGPVSASQLARETGLAERRVKVVLSSLEAMGICKRGRGGVTLARRFADHDELERYAHSYESRFDTDKKKLEDMMHYAQATDCRVRRIVEYFGEESAQDCGHCDNCRDRPSHIENEPARAALGEVFEVPLPRFGVGDVVEHATFGTGTIELTGTEHVTVRFASGQKTMHPDYLEALASA